MSNLIVTKEDIIENSPKKTYVRNYIKQLEERNLLPLTNDNQNLKILARICGALFSDGSLYDGTKINNYREIGFSLGQKQDVEELERDFRVLKYKTHSNSKTSKIAISGRKFVMNNFRLRCTSTSLFILLKSLKIPVGKKTDIDYKVPDWIMNGTKEIKKEFLAAYIGGDGPKVTINVVKRKDRASYNQVGINDLEFYKRTDLIKSGYYFGKQIFLLLNEFGVKVNRIFHSKEQFPRKDGTKSVSIHLGISHKIESALNLCKIGYTYCNQKRTLTKDVMKFLQHIVDKRKAWKDLYNKSFELHNKGNTAKKISEILDLNYDPVFGWVKKQQNAIRKST